MTDKPSKGGEWLPSGMDDTGVGLKVKDDISWENFSAGAGIISRLANFSHERLPYIIGDLINAGERLFPNKYEQALELTDYTIGTLRNYAYMCRHVPPENRKIGTVPHTMVAASLPAESQKGALERAMDEGLSANEMRKMVKGEPEYKTRALPDPCAKMDKVLEGWGCVWMENREKWEDLSMERACRDAYAAGAEKMKG